MSERHEIIAAGIRRREAMTTSGPIRGLDRVDIRIVDLLAYEAQARGERGVMRIGEPVDRGGDGEGSSPLAHFLTGCGACLLNQFVRIAISDGLPLTFGGATVRGEFGREVGGAFERIEVRVEGSGRLERDAADELVRRAERLCYLHQTLVHAVELTTVLVLDGEEAAVHRDGPHPLTGAPRPPG
jgi:uncharacterized OsmC-like protein